jgi:hypothetical protein
MHELGDTILLPDDGVSFESTDACLVMISGKERVLARLGRAGEIGKERVLRERGLSRQARGGRVQWRLGWAGETGKRRVSARLGWVGEIDTIAFGVEKGFRRTGRPASPSHEVIAIVLHILKVVPPRRRDRGRISQELPIQILHERKVGEKR